MTNMTDSSTSVRPSSDPGRSRFLALVEWFIATPLVAHVVVVAVLLVLGLSLVHPTGTWTSDEGAVRSQVELLSTQGSWSAVRPFSDLDPEEITSPIHASTIVGERYSPYTKQPALPVVLAPVRSVAGEAALVLPALLGALLAAVIGSLIAGSFTSRIRNLTLWVIAFATPVLFYGYTVLGHTAAAALGALAVFVVLRWGERLSPTWLFAIGAMFVAPLFRAEAFAFGIALGVAVIIAQRGVRWSVRGSLSVSIVAASLAGLIVNQRWAASVGGGDPVSEGQRILDWFRLVSGAFSSLILVDFGTVALLGVVVMMTGGAALVAVAVHREPDNRRFHLVAASLSIAGSVSLLFLAPIPVGGLLAATPVLVAGMLLLRREDLSDRSIRLIVTTAVLFVSAVFLTQERGGGGAQWGGRYLMPIVAILVPVAILLLRRLLQSAPHAARLVVVPLVIAVLVLTIDAAVVLRSGRENSAELTHRLVQLADSVGGSSSESPVILSSRTHIGRHAWRTTDDIDYFLVPEEAFDVYLDRLVESGESRFGVVGAWTPDRRALFESHGFAAVDPATAPFIVVGRIDG
ncbi:MAG: hypothetical protein BMS9Abin17_0089 [Acidimicrobiia bacterium]|nr:MAG: hypothetical protein BMS9Abin17_0089 [Acidimicrobiia bacterium]